VKHAGEFRPESAEAYDSLTGLVNERGLFERLDADLKRCREQLGALALLLCGVDGLSQLEARFGGAARARLVQAIAAALCRTSRKEDCVARVGDEFALLLQGFPKSAFDTKRSRIAALVVGVGVAHFGEMALAARVGDAYFPADASDAESLLAIAAERLRAAPPLPDRLTEDLARIAAAMDESHAWKSDPAVFAEPYRAATVRKHSS